MSWCRIAGLGGEVMHVSQDRDGVWTAAVRWPTGAVTQGTGLTEDSALQDTELVYGRRADIENQLR